MDKRKGPTSKALASPMLNVQPFSKELEGVAPLAHDEGGMEGGDERNKQCREWGVPPRKIRWRGGWARICAPR